MRIFAFRAFIAGAVCFWAASSAVAGVAYDEPAGGWLYSYDGAATNFGSGGGGAGAADSLDGTWSRGGGSDSWDGSGLGGVFDDLTNDPGGLQAFTEGATTYIRLQDTGDPGAQGAVLGYTPTGTRNSKIYLNHPLALPDNAMDSGITITFRIRLAITGLLDSQYPGSANESENIAVPGGTPWPAEGNGYFNHSGGKGLVGIHQGSSGMISFSPAVSSDQRRDRSLFGQSGLMMNNLNGSAITGMVDPYNLHPGIENVFSLFDWSQWHEFWITINADTSGGGTHRVRLYIDGSFTPAIFDVTAGDGNEGGTTSTQTYLGMGLGSTSQMGAVDVDYVAVKEGVVAPVPEPGVSVTLLGGAVLLGGVRRPRARRT